MKVGMKLGLGFGVVLVFMIILIFVAISNMGAIQENLERIVKVNNVRSTLADNMADLEETINPGRYRPRS